MNITFLDGAVLAITLISALLAMFRGFVREVLSIAAWVIAAVAAYAFYDDLLPFVRQYIRQEYVDVALSVTAIFFVTLIVVSIITIKIADFVIDSRIGFLDRTFGFVFGAARGILLAVVGVIFFNWLVAEENRPGWMTRATSYPLLTTLGDDLVAALPENPQEALLETLDARFRSNPSAEPRAAGDSAEYDPNAQRGLDQLIESTGEDGAAPTEDDGISIDGSTPTTRDPARVLPPPRPSN